MVYKCKYYGKEYDFGKSMGGHTINCKSNPNKYTMTNEHKLKLSLVKVGRPGHKHTTKQRKNISNGMILAVKEGRAVAWKNHHKLKNSYAEDFFIKVINNEFNNKKFVKEYRMGKYSIDFAWPELKLGIEIDGQQHEFPERKKSDRLKDTYLSENGWKILRIKWKDMFQNTNIAKTFIDNAVLA